MKQPSNYVAILIACGMLVSVSVPASGSSEDDRINGLVEQDSVSEAPAADGDYLPIVKSAPMYPRRAQSRGLAGHCDLEFTVTPQGTTADVQVIECTSPLFEKASVQAVLKFKYKPRLVNGTAIAVPGVRHRIKFEMDERGKQAIESGEPEVPAAEGDYLPIVKVVPMYPRQAQSQGLEGHCDLEFTVTPLGTTADVRVIECTSSLFEQASVQALLKFKYKPQVVNGTASAVPELRHRMMFQME